MSTAKISAAHAYLAKVLADKGLASPQCLVICGSGLSTLSEAAKGDTIVVPCVACLAPCAGKY